MIAYDTQGFGSKHFELYIYQHMKNKDILPLILFILSVAYWLYLVDPFKGKPVKRNYNKLLNNRRYFFTQLIISGILVIINFFLLRQCNADSGTMFFLTSFFFILIVKGINQYFRMRFDRNIIFLVRGDAIKTPFADILGSILLFIVPFTLAIVILILLKNS